MNSKQSDGELDRAWKASMTAGIGVAFFGLMGIMTGTVTTPETGYLIAAIAGLLIIVGWFL